MSVRGAEEGPFDAEEQHRRRPEALPAVVQGQDPGCLDDCEKVFVAGGGTVTAQDGGKVFVDKDGGKVFIADPK